MNIADYTSVDVNTNGGGERPPHTGLAPDVLPEVQKPVLAENSQTGVSTKNALSGTGGSTTPKTIRRKPKDVPHWHALRVTYGREKKAYEYLVGKHVEAFYPNPLAELIQCVLNPSNRFIIAAIIVAACVIGLKCVLSCSSKHDGDKSASTVGRASRPSKAYGNDLPFYRELSLYWLADTR